jgi:hypothetical protein
MIHETFHRFPGVEQSHVVVVKDVAVLIPWILLVPGLKCKWSVNETEIQYLSLSLSRLASKAGSTRSGR